MSEITLIVPNLNKLEKEKITKLKENFTINLISTIEHYSYNNKFILWYLNREDDFTLIKKLIEKNIIIVCLIDKDNQNLTLKLIDLGINKFYKREFEAENFKNILTSKNSIEDTSNYKRVMSALIDNFTISKTDSNGVITYVNDKFCESSGFAKEELIGKTHGIVKHPDTKSHIFKSLWSSILDKKVWQGVVKNRTKDNKFYITEALIIPILNLNGDIKEFLSIRKDITEKEILKEKIEEKIKEQEIIKAREKAKDSFLILFTHELKTPLNAIINFNSYMMESLKECQSTKRDKLINLSTLSRDNAVYMLNIVTNLLDIAKLKSGKIKFSYTTLSINSIIREIINEFSSLIDKKDMEVIFNFKSECIIKSDELRFKQILSNIISNAIKYGNRKLFITLDKCMQDDFKFRLSIADDGCGIKDKKRVFEMYEQDNQNILKKDEGTGIGLHMVKLICEGLQIEYKVEDSRILGGTNFILSEKLRKGI